MLTTRRPSPLPILPYRKPTPGRDYWLLDDALPNADAVRQRCLAIGNWERGYPYTEESWPGLRATPALLPDELALLESKVKHAIGTARLWAETAPDGARLNHNCIQVVGIDESGPKPHTDSRRLCRFAAVLYLNPHVPPNCGTSFYRQRMPGGRLGGNMVLPPHDNMVEALGTRFVPADAFVEDVQIAHTYNRLLLYRANLLHSATGYWGADLPDKRMAAVFFWMA